MVERKPQLSVENIFEKPKYRIIFHLLMWNYYINQNFVPQLIDEHKLKFRHFRYSLLNEHGLSPDVVKRVKKFFKIEIPKERVNQVFPKAHLDKF